MADNVGKKFEKDFQDSCNIVNVCNVRLKDSNKFGGGNDKTRFTPENPCDFIVYHEPHIYFLELKSTIGSGITFNQPVTVQERGKAKPMIKAHQVKELMRYSQYKGAICGLVLRYENKETHDGVTYFIDIMKFVDWTTTVDKKSINKHDVESLGIEINSQLLRVNKRYDIMKFIRDTSAVYD